MNVDPKFTKKIQDWLNAEPKANDACVEGAELLRRIAPTNRIYMRFFSIALTNPSSILPKVEYELKKHLAYRLDGLTLEQVNQLDATVIPEAEAILGEGCPAEDSEADMTGGGDESETVRQRGRRDDHEQLPDEIKALWVDCASLYKQIKEVFEELKSMEDLPSCDRYDKLQVLASMDKRYFRQMQQYDEYVIEPSGNEAVTLPLSTADSAKAVTTARSYISNNRAKLAELAAQAAADGASDDDHKKYAEQLAKLQSRVDVLVAAHADITDSLRDSLVELGLRFKTQSDDGQDNSKSSETSE
ncbi:hypothetical protein [Segatella buccae]|uniref:hypothetical protein n=1 Tax=Segatella buccae TaxID=28126 RepID=UPI0028D8A451|nr:hypothetical protein [Segatella buccae]